MMKGDHAPTKLSHIFHKINEQFSTKCYDAWELVGLLCAKTILVW